MSLDLAPLEAAIAQLESSLDVYNSKLASEPELGKYLRSSVIQAFEFTYELTVKMVERHLRLHSANPQSIDTMNFGDMIREAYKKGVICSDLPAWDEHRKKRATTSHTYNESKAQAVFEGAPAFLDEARCTLSRLQELNKPFGKSD